MNNNNEGIIINPVSKEEIEHPEHVTDVIERLNLPHPDYDG